MNRHGQFRVVQTLFLYISWIDVNGYVQYCRILHTYPISRVHKRDPITSNIFKNKSWALIELLYLHKRLKVNRKQTSQLGRIEASEFSYVMQHNVRRWQQTKRHALAEGKERKKSFLAIQKEKWRIGTSSSSVWIKRRLASNWRGPWAAAALYIRSPYL